MSKIIGRNTITLTLRGSAETGGRLDFFFKEMGQTNLLENKYWFTRPIPAGADLDFMMDFLNDPNNIWTYREPLAAYADEPIPYLGPAYVSGWPVVQSSNGSWISLMAQAPYIHKETDILGEKLVIEFCMNPCKWTYYQDQRQVTDYNEATVYIANDKGLTGFGALNIASDYSTYVRFNSATQYALKNQFANTKNVYMSLRFMVNTWLTGDASTAEDIGKAPKYFYVPIYAGDTLSAIAHRIQSGDSSRIACKPLQTQLNEYFNQVGLKTGLIQQNAFEVEAKFTEGKRQGAQDELTLHKSINDILEVRIKAMSEDIQHEVSCCAYQTSELYIVTLCNQYFIGENMFELRSFYEMYGVDKPYGTSASKDYKPLAYGFKFNLDYITDYQETESSTLDVTPIPGQSSARAIGIDATGATREITITGTRVDNSNYWMFHVPWQEEGMNEGIIYTGTSNWGWIKFMKAVLGCFQMTSGPYRLIMLTVPSSAMQQYFPTRDGTFQYSDGTYVMYVGWEDMCYVMVESFNCSKTEDMFNAINYTLKLKRVTPLLASL